MLIMFSALIIMCIIIMYYHHYYYYHYCLLHRLPDAGSGPKGFSQRDCKSSTCCHVFLEKAKPSQAKRSEAKQSKAKQRCARVATCCNMLPHSPTCCLVCRTLPTSVHENSLGGIAIAALCDRPVCPDPVWKPSNNRCAAPGAIVIYIYIYINRERER